MKLYAHQFEKFNDIGSFNTQPVKIHTQKGNISNMAQ